MMEKDLTLSTLQLALFGAQHQYEGAAARKTEAEKNEASCLDELNRVRTLVNQRLRGGKDQDNEPVVEPAPNKEAQEATSAPKKPRKLTAAQKRRNRSEAQKARWAAKKAAAEAPAETDLQRYDRLRAEKNKPKRKISAAGKKAIAAAQKKRWAEYNKNKAG